MTFVNHVACCMKTGIRYHRTHTAQFLVPPMSGAPNVSSSEAYQTPESRILPLSLG